MFLFVVSVFLSPVIVAITVDYEGFVSCQPIGMGKKSGKQKEMFHNTAPSLHFICPDKQLLHEKFQSQCMYNSVSSYLTIVPVKFS